MKSALVAAQHLQAMAQAIRAGYPVDESFNRQYGEELARIHGVEMGVYRRQCQASWSHGSKSYDLGARALAHCFLRAIKGY